MPQQKELILYDQEGNLTACHECRKLCDQSIENNQYIPDSAVTKLLSLDHLNCIKHLVKQRPESIETLSLAAAAFGHVDCLQMLV